tara:strand:+ start:200 stop:628 length:429 start_codon:yes stop_codon:yes gene_type:complete
METYLNNKVLKCEVAVFGIRGIVHSNGLFNEMFNSKNIKMQLNKVYETLSDITVKVSLDEFSVFTEIIWRNKTILNFKGYPNSTQLHKLEDLEFNAGENGYSQPFKSKKLYISKSIAFRFFIDEKEADYEWDANNQVNWENK